MLSQFRVETYLGRNDHSERATISLYFRIVTLSEKWHLPLERPHRGNWELLHTDGQIKVETISNSIFAIKKGFYMIRKVLLLAAVLFVATTAHSKSTVPQPLNRTEIVLIHHDMLLKSNDEKYLVLQCLDSASTVLKECKVYKVLERSGAGKKTQEKILGHFPHDHLADFLAQIGGNYDNKFRTGPLIICTLYGFLMGEFTGGLPAALGGSFLGLMVDLAKLPVALAFSVSSFTHRKYQRENLLARLSDLLFNRTYRSTRVKSRKHFMQIENGLIEYLDGFRHLSE